MDFWNGFIAVVIFAGALWYLYRTIIKKKGCSCGSDSCCRKDSLVSKKQVNGEATKKDSS